MKKDEYYDKAKKIYKKEVEFEINRIANTLRKEAERDRVRAMQDKCSHPRVESYNHGYHTYCVECGKDL